jgi:hypothetical protein
VVSVDELDIDSIDESEKGMAALHPKLEGEELECYCSDVCKMEVSGDYKMLWQRSWMCNNLACDPEPSNTEAQNNDCVVMSHLKYVMSYEKY